MKKLLIGAAFCALFAAPALAAEPVKLSLTQMDRVTAGACVVAICTQTNALVQTATAAAVGGASAGSILSSNAKAVAFNKAEQENEID